MRKFSIIIPTHNRMDLLSTCLDSILQQTYSDFEVIIIDDGSVDKTEELIQQNYNHSKIKYYKVCFNDISKVRNYALERVSGDTIVFVDSDDRVENRLLEKLKEQDNKNDIIRYQAVMVDDKNEIIERFITSSFKNMRGTQALNLFTSNYEIYSPVWLYAFDVEFWDKHGFKFPEGMLQEDFAVMSSILNEANCVSSIPYIGYNYYQSSNSIMRNSDYQAQVKKAYDMLAHCDIFFKQIVLNQSDEALRNNLINYYLSVLEHKEEMLNGKEQKEFTKELNLRRQTWR